MKEAENALDSVGGSNVAHQWHSITDQLHPDPRKNAPSTLAIPCDPLRWLREHPRIWPPVIIILAKDLDNYHWLYSRGGNYE